LVALGAAPYGELQKAANLEAAQSEKSAQTLLSSGQMVALENEGAELRPKSWVVARPYWEQAVEKIYSILSAYHQKYPLRLGVSIEEVKSRVKIEPRVFSGLLARLAEDGDVVVKGSMMRLPAHAVNFTPAQQARIDALLARFSAAPFSPPTIKESIAEVGEDLYQTLVAMGRLLPVSSEVVFRTEDYQQALADVRSLAEQHGTFTLAQARDHWGTTRRYVQDLLEYMDQEGVTLRVGDARKLRG